MKYVKYTLLIVAILAIIFGTNIITKAEKSNETIADKQIIIDAEDIGIKEIEYKFDNELTHDDIENDIVEDESNKKSIEDLETENSEPPKNMVEGYVENEYFEPNENDCEICEECYSCDNNGHIYIHTVSFDEDNKSYTYEEWCEICGHGTEKTITENEFDSLNIECDVEF